MTSITTRQLPPIASSGPNGKRRFYTSLWFQVCIAIVLAIVLGCFSPSPTLAMKPLGDAFIRLITMIVTRGIKANFA